MKDNIIDRLFSFLSCTYLCVDSIAKKFEICFVGIFYYKYAAIILCNSAPQKIIFKFALQGVIKKISEVNYKPFLGIHTLIIFM